VSNLSKCGIVRSFEKAMIAGVGAWSTEVGEVVLAPQPQPEAEILAEKESLLGVSFRTGQLKKVLRRLLPTGFL
jgi:hypothetical protein